MEIKARYPKERVEAIIGRLTVDVETLREALQDARIKQIELERENESLQAAMSRSGFDHDGRTATIGPGDASSDAIVVTRPAGERCPANDVIRRQDDPIDPPR